MNWKILVVIITALLITRGNSVLYSALRMCDSDTCDIDMTYSGGVYNLTIPSAYLQLNNLMSFCYRQRTAVNDTNGTCDLTGYDSTYNCLLFTSVSSPYSSSLSVYQADATLAPNNGTPTALPDSNLTVSHSTTSIAISVLKKDVVYEMVAGTGQNLATNPNSKSVFFHTFRGANKTSYIKTGLFMQRYV